MLNLLLYVLIGIGAIVIAYIDLLIAVKQDGHSVILFLDWFDKTYSWKEPNVSVTFAIFATLWGMIIWPLRLLRWYTVHIDVLMDAYSEHVNIPNEE